MMHLEETQAPIADEQREEMQVRKRANIAPGTKMIVLAVALLAGAMILYGVSIKMGFWGNKEVKSASAQQETAAAPKAPKFDAPQPPMPIPRPIAQQPMTDASALDGQPSTACPGGEKLPPGMPITMCPTHDGGAQPNHGNGANGATGQAAGQPGPNEKTLNPTQDDVRVRRLGGDLQVASTDKEEQGGSKQAFPSAQGAGQSGGLMGGAGQQGPREATALGAAMVATETARATAKFYANQDLTIAKGQMPDCTLRTAIRTSVNGFIQCVLAAPVFSMNGKVELLPVGTVINGEYNQGVTAGQRAIFTIWSDARTPEGVKVDLGSPGTDQLGRAGTDGYIDNKWMERYAGAVFYSLFDDVMNIQLAKANSDSGSNNISLYPSSTGTSKAIVEEMLKQNSAIKPDLYKLQGEVIKIFIARDVDFSSVYQLRSRRREF